MAQHRPDHGPAGASSVAAARPSPYRRDEDRDRQPAGDEDQINKVAVPVRTIVRVAVPRDQDVEAPQDDVVRSTIPSSRHPLHPHAALRDRRRAPLHPLQPGNIGVEKRSPRSVARATAPEPMRIGVNRIAGGGPEAPASARARQPRRGADDGPRPSSRLMTASTSTTQGLRKVDERGRTRSLTTECSVQDRHPCTLHHRGGPKLRRAA